MSEWVNECMGRWVDEEVGRRAGVLSNLTVQKESNV